MSKNIGVFIAKIRFAIDQAQFFSRLHLIYTNNEKNILKNIVIILGTVAVYSIMPEPWRNAVNATINYIVEAVSGDKEKEKQIVEIVKIVLFSVSLTSLSFWLGEINGSKKAKTTFKNNIPGKTNQDNQNNQNNGRQSVQRRMERMERMEAQ